MDKPSVSFVFPVRWLNEDKEYLSQNLKNKIEKSLGEGVRLNQILNYYVVLVCNSPEPEKMSLSERDVQKILKTTFPNAKCLELRKEYLQSRSKTKLATIDFKLYI